MVESTTLNGHTWQSSYNAAARRMTLTSAAGRVSTIDYDAIGRVTQIAPPGVQALTFHYDAHGRNDSISQGARVTKVSYRSDGFLGSLVDPLQRSTVFDYDLVGRPLTATLPDLSVLGAAFDHNDNLTSVTPPGKSAHGFSYQAGDLESDYTSPAVDGSGTGHVHTNYNLDRQVSLSSGARQGTGLAQEARFERHFQRPL